MIPATNADHHKQLQPGVAFWVSLAVGWRRVLTAVAAATLLVACTTNTQPGSSTADPSRAPQTTVPPDAEPTTSSSRHATRWTLGATSLTIEVGKSGRLARLGHNHVVYSNAVTGELAFSNDNQLIANIAVPVSSLSVDDPEQRAVHRARDPQTYGSVPSQQQIDGTRANMLGRRVLHASEHAFITAQVFASSEHLMSELDNEVLTQGSHLLPIEMNLSIAGHHSDLNTELSWQRSGSQLFWQTQFTVTHEQLGLKPFSALAGALSVAQELEISLAGEIERVPAP